MNLKIKQSAFTLVELMVVVAIIGIVSAISLASLKTIQQTTKDAQRQSDLRVIQGALQQFYADQNYYPNSLTLSTEAALTDCSGNVSCTVSKTYIKATPVDPAAGTTTPYCYVSQKSVTDTTSCVAAPGKCHFYRLAAKLESPASSAVSSTCNSVAGYNFELNPL